MIITKLIGGLGNQMFQYAAGLALAKKNKMFLRVDTRALKSYKLHQGYQLPELFCGEFKEVTDWELYKCLGLWKRKATHGSVSVDPLWRFHNKKRIIRQCTHNYWDQFEHLENTCYLAGYWQSSKYFMNFEKDIRKAFQFAAELDDTNAEIAKQMALENSISIHVRRGDYVTNPNSQKFHGICEWSYYKRAIEIISEQIPNPKFYVFSDDVTDTVNNIGPDSRITVVDLNKSYFSYRDMQLMTHCKHHIIANSSFSWWGAWLSQNDQKIVIAPKTWFAGAKDQPIDIYEKNWIRI